MTDQSHDAMSTITSLKSDQPMPETIEVVRWNDEIVNAHGYDPRSMYVERFWLSLIGPSSVWLLRRLTRGLEEHPNGFRASSLDMSKALGLGESLSKNAPLKRTIRRLSYFDLAQQLGPQRIAVRTMMPPLVNHQLDRLPHSLRESHDAWIAEAQSGTLATKARRTAECLAELGQDIDLIETDLKILGFAPATISHAMAFATQVSVLTNQDGTKSRPVAEHQTQ